MYNKQKILEIDKNHIWHPFTQMKDYENRSPKVIVKGKGVKLYDIDGNEYYDTISSWWTNILGHCNTRINEALKTQVDLLEHVNFSGITHPYAVEFIDRLNNNLDDSIRKYFFSDNGSTAVEVALKMAFQYWQNKGKTEKIEFTTLKNSYHGDTIGAVSLSAIPLYHKLYAPLTFKTNMIDSPDCSNCSYNKDEFTFDAKNIQCNVECFEKIKENLVKNAGNTAAVIVEPMIQCAGGMLIYKKEYLEKLRNLTLELDVLLIFDEVATGFGRTGTLFAYEQTDIVPDIICLSKGITAGYMPLSVTGTTDKIYNAFYDDYFSYKTFFHGHSYTANPLACAIGIESLKILEERNLPYSNIETIEYFHNKLKEFTKYDYIGDIRYIGFIGAIDIVKSRNKNKVYDIKLRIGQKICDKFMENGLISRCLGDTIYWLLPLIITKNDIDIIFEKSLKCIKEIVDEQI